MRKRTHTAVSGAARHIGRGSWTWVFDDRNCAIGAVEQLDDGRWRAALDELIATFPFVTKADRSVALSAMLTTLDRHAMATAPLHAFTSPAADTGKSLLVDIAATLATGRRMPVISQGRTEEELEKRLQCCEQQAFRHEKLVNEREIQRR